MGEVGELAQLGERLLCTQEVTGSIPVFSTKFEVETEAFWKRNDSVSSSNLPAIASGEGGQVRTGSLTTEYLAHLAEIVRAMEAGALGATSLRSAAIDRESAFSKF